MRLRRAFTAGTFVAVVIIGCTSERDLSRLPGTYVSSDGKYVLVLRDDRTGQLRVDGHAPGALGSPCDPPDVCNEGVCGPAFTDVPTLQADHVCQCALGPDRRPLVAGCVANLSPLKPVPLVIETDPFDRVQLRVDESYPNIRGDFVCWSCGLDASGMRFECEHSHPKPGELLPQTCSFDRAGAGGASLDGGRATTDAAARGVSCGNTTCPRGRACCRSSTGSYCSTSDTC